MRIIVLRLHFRFQIGNSKKSNSSSDLDNTGTIPEETGSDGEVDGEIELATKAELLDHPALPSGFATDDIAMMDEEENGSRALCAAVDAMSGICVSEAANGRPAMHRTNEAR